MSAVRRVVALGALLALALAGPAAAQSGGARLRLVKVGNFASPLYAVSPPGDPSRVLVVERTGRIWVVRHGRRLPRPFLDIRVA